VYWRKQRGMRLRGRNVLVDVGERGFVVCCEVMAFHLNIVVDIVAEMVGTRQALVTYSVIAIKF
jgi:hypothetical protein